MIKAIQSPEQNIAVSYASPHLLTEQVALACLSVTGLIHTKTSDLTLSIFKQLRMSPSYSYYSKCCFAVTCNRRNSLVNVV